MFEYTREFILNDNVGSLSTGHRFDALDNHLVVARMVNLDKKNITRVTKYPYVAAANEKVELKASAMPKATAADKVVRLVITIREEGKVTALVNDSYPWHSKYYFYEGLPIATASPTVFDLPFAEWEKQSKKEEAMEAEDRLITVRYDSVGDKLVIEAKDCYTRIFEVRVVEAPKDVVNVPVAEVLTGYKDYNVLVDLKMPEMHVDTATAPGTGYVYAGTVGTEGAGTVARILKNMRLLTAANINPWGLNRDERPLPNGQYTQYAIEYIVERRGIGSQVMGAIDHSLSNHLFFVESGAVADFDAALTALGLTVEAAVSAGLPLPVIPVVGPAKVPYLDADQVSITGTGTATVSFNVAPADAVVVASSDVTKATAAYANGAVTITGVAAGSANVKVGTADDDDKFGVIAVTVA